ncbi:MAG: methionine adenosyltransferase domain-containing protein [Candidatus Aenigmarchaeota archaeon]|nr:methionine adenosyltransferase domain-containing protein [Candidatus Aenigmarchaeota archaeon]
MYHTTNAEVPRRAHPDRLANAVATQMVSYLLAENPAARADIDAMLAGGKKGASVYIAGNVATTLSQRQLNDRAREAVSVCARRCGYTAATGFNPDDFELATNFTPQSPELTHNAEYGGAGDTRTVIGYACNETGRLLPRAVVAAEQIAGRLDAGLLPYLRPDGKVQVVYADGRPTVIIAVQHEPGVTAAELRRDLFPWVCGAIGTEDVDLIVKPFVNGGPVVDKGTSNTKRGIYGEAIPHYGGGPWGKDGSKPEVSGLVAARALARKAVQHGADEYSVALTYPLGAQHPLVTMNWNADLKNARVVLRKSRDDITNLSPEWLAQAYRLRDAELFDRIAQTSFIGNEALPWERTD